MNREKELAKNTIILSIGAFLSKLIATVTLPLITGCLTTAEYGTYDLIVTLVVLLLPAATLQIQSAAFRFLMTSRGDAHESKKIITNILSFTTVISLAAVSVLLILMKNYQEDVKFAIAAYFISDILLTAIRQIVRGLGDNLIFAFDAILNSIIMLFLTAVQLLVFKAGLFGVLFALAGSTIFSLAFLSIKEKIWHYFDIRLLSLSKIKELLNYSWPIVPNNLSGWVLLLSDRLVITTFIGVEANAVYAVANKIPNLILSFQTTFTLAWQENAALTVNDGDTKEYYSKMVSEITSLLVGVTGWLIAATPVLFFLLIRGNYSKAYYQMPILYMGVFCSFISSMIGGIYTAHMKTKSVGITTSLAAALNLIIDLLLVKKIGIYAGSVSTLISYLFLLIYRMIDVRRFQPIKYDLKKLAFGALIMMIMSALLYTKNTAANIINILIAAVFSYTFNKTYILSLLNKLKKFKH
ncbi:MAG: oligosaccharide flippase family protein [Clostridiales bacterium]|nr:oligosaccharide flippase family protein [Clostridiales bacterium]